jgi:hypothetical protein
MNTMHEANRWKIAGLLHTAVDAGLRPGRILESPAMMSVSGKGIPTSQARNEADLNQSARPDADRQR